MLKRGGRGHDPAGAAGTKNGELALMCPSCPHPGINLPAGWADAPPILRFLYLLILCIDANFRLKNQLVSTYSQDPGLGIGMSYMVPREPYESYVLSRASDADVSEIFKPSFHALMLSPDQHLRRLLCVGQSQHEIFAGPAVYRGWGGFVWEVGNVASERCWEFTEGRTVCYFCL